MKRIGFIAVHYKSVNETINYLSSISSLKSDDWNIFVVIVDNSSDFRYNRTFSSINVEVIRFGNIGYFAGLNKGLQSLENAALDYVVVGNNDVEFGRNFLLNLLSVKHGFYVLAPRITNLDGDEQNPHVIGDLSWLRFMYLRLVYSSYFTWACLPRILHILLPKRILRRDEQEYANAQFIGQGHGSCFVLTSSYLKEFKLLPELSFMYGEEFFLSYQLRKKDLRIFYEPSLRVFHKEHSSISKGTRRTLYKMQLEGFKKEMELRKIIEDGSL